ncbi:KAP family P-loop NTPase fold protein [Ancylobacter oerskovii]|uniref:P-loop NTPase fold protein n=1 Tax=Ancylobacter oerskovii TaxID=459519 RepID=A0ABW4YUD8_9HYPH|nr:P-loop NTPase fold protein [Ancylobacter oerskovii]MBS7544645.1 hypothetical protein [Ancylobacter oerskovii]
MRIQPPVLEIGDEDGFKPEWDIFGRAAFGHGLTNLVQTVEDPLVILLDSPWGSGKSTFLKMWAGELRKAGHPVIYFDAFAHDHIDNAFLAIAGEVIGLAKAKKDLEKSTISRFVDKAAKTGRILLRSTIKVGVKAATLGAIDATDLEEELKDISGDIAKATSEHADDYVRNLLLRQSEEKETLDSFRDALGELAADMASDTGGEVDAQGRRPLIFILDELDRCKPPFALDLLETIKHLFSVANVHFLLSAHLSQLEASARYSYGSQIDARLYLQKFYNFSISFPNEHEELRKTTRSIYIKHLSKQFGPLSQRDNEIEHMIEVLDLVAEARQMPLRTIERIATILTFSMAMTPKGNLRIPPIIIGLAVMKVCDPELFSRAKSGALALSDIENVFEFQGWSPDKESEAETIRQWWMFCCEEKLPDDIGVDWQYFARAYFRYSYGSRTRLVPLLARTVVERLSN